MTLGHFVAGDHRKGDQPFCQIITVYTKEQEYKKQQGEKDSNYLVSKMMPTDGDGTRTGSAMHAIGAETINMTTQREVCVLACVCVFKEGLSDNRYKNTTEQSENPDTSDQLDISSYWSCH